MFQTNSKCLYIVQIPKVHSLAPSVGLNKDFKQIRDFLFNLSDGLPFPRSRLRYPVLYNTINNRKFRRV
jgi:hypothetical protein